MAFVREPRKGIARQCNSAGLPGFGGQGPLAGAAWDMVIRSNPAEILKSKPILDLVELSDVPSNDLLIKGVFSRKGGGNVPLLDTRVPLASSMKDQAADACALIVDVEGAEVGMIIGEVKSA